jgi:hypothetical protein
MAFGAAVEILAEFVGGALDAVCIFIAGVDMVNVGLGTVGSCWCFFDVGFSGDVIVDVVLVVVAVIGFC